ncbi:DNA-nicking endonuclease, Smr domain [Nannocystis exedens]|uniref:DNA-nicking endonuclease, Smr domain n=1 Tax=Nannocystis exedens TaxID=54 RepID=A0A1I1WD22_9BACT|nr:Smr/MutS family protein [Nannocystis exedens]PCC67517.1 Smr domain protein [Nannocystis exedens]SFD91303.1 DNA-nicking endonuclease, Smr domain [Nannocystis exedens]
MPRRRRPGRTGASPRSAPPEPEGRLRAPLAALFPDGLPAPPPPAPPPQPQPQLISERELMARAFAALATGDPLDFDALRVVTRLPAGAGLKRQVSATSSPQTTGSQGRPTGASQPASRPAANSTAADARSAAPASEREDAEAFTTLMRAQGVAPQRAAPPPTSPVAALQGRAWAGAGWRDDPGRTREHARAAAELVARARRGRLPTLRLRGLRREPAVEALIAFVARERAAGSRYVRVVTGKGLGSPGDPVLKEALAEWCASVAGETDVAAWAPELDVRGEYGSVILQLRPRA